MTPNGWPLVLVEWEDSHYLGVGWQGPIEFEDIATICESVGWLAFDGEKVKVLMPHRSVQEGSLKPRGRHHADSYEVHFSHGTVERTYFFGGFLSGA